MTVLLTIWIIAGIIGLLKYGRLFMIIKSRWLIFLITVLYFMFHGQYEPEKVNPKDYEFKGWQHAR